MEDIIKEIEKFNVFGSKLGLERIEALLSKIGKPQKDLEVIHVAGTNGKGSVSAYIYEVLMQAGYTAGLFTSPFIERFNERIQINGKCISDEKLEKYGREVISAAKAMKSGGKSPTEFEIITAIALKAFAEEDVDFCVLEVGLGGRGDSTNVARNTVASIITSISYDHMDRLGDTIEKIAYEKAGIIKNGVPVFMNVDKDEAKKVIAKEAYAKGCALYDLSGAVLTDIKITEEGSVFNASIRGKNYKNVSLSMPGEHQCVNAVTAIGVIDALRQKGIIEADDTALSAGLKKAVLPGRFEILQGDSGKFSEKYFVLDGAHNEEGAEMSLKTLDDVFYGKKVLVLTGVLKDKAVTDIVRFLSSMGKKYIAVPVDNNRTLESEKLAELLRQYSDNVCACTSAKEGLSLALSKLDDYDVCICVGSLYLVGKIRSLLKREHFFKTCSR